MVSLVPSVILITSCYVRVPGFQGLGQEHLQFSSVPQLCLTLCYPMAAPHQDSLSITNSQSLLKFTSIKLVLPSNHLSLYHPLLLPPSIFPSIRVFSSKSVLHVRWPKYWSFSFTISPSNEHSGLISFRMDWFDPLAAKGLSRVGLELDKWSQSHKSPPPGSESSRGRQRPGSLLWEP